MYIGYQTIKYQLEGTLEPAEIDSLNPSSIQSAIGMEYRYVFKNLFKSPLIHAKGWWNNEYGKEFTKAEIDKNSHAFDTDLHYTLLKLIFRALLVPVDRAWIKTKKENSVIQALIVPLLALWMFIRFFPLLIEVILRSVTALVDAAYAESPLVFKILLFPFKQVLHRAANVIAYAANLMDGVVSTVLSIGKGILKSIEYVFNPVIKVTAKSLWEDFKFEFLGGLKAIAISTIKLLPEAVMAMIYFFAPPVAAAIDTTLGIMGGASGIGLAIGVAITSYAPIAVTAALVQGYDYGIDYTQHMSGPKKIEVNSSSATPQMTSQPNDAAEPGMEEPSVLKRMLENSEKASAQDGEVIADTASHLARLAVKNPAASSTSDSHVSDAEKGSVSEPNSPV